MNREPSFFQFATIAAAIIAAIMFAAEVFR